MMRNFSTALLWLYITLASVFVMVETRHAISILERIAVCLESATRIFRIGGR